MLLNKVLIILLKKQNSFLSMPKQRYHPSNIINNQGTKTVKKENEKCL